MNVYFLSVGSRPFAAYTARSFKAWIPGCEIVQFTDYGTLQARGVDKVVRTGCRKDSLMLCMINAFAKIKDDVFITTGDDCILNGPIDDILSENYDVCLVKRTKPRIDDSGFNITEHYPYTNGLVIVKHPEFYGDCRDSMVVDHPDLWGWFGDMASIRDIVDSGKYRVKLLDEDKYCRIPTRLGQGDDSAVLWHYSGKVRKEWMAYHGKGEDMAAEQRV